MTSVARSPYRAEVGWSGYATGLFTIGTSLIGGPDTLGSGLYSEAFTGLYDNVSADLDRITISRGRDDTLANMVAGEASIFLRDPNGFYSPQSPTSPLAATMEDRLHPARISAKTAPPLPYYQPLFYGYAKRIVWEPQGRRGITQIELVDLFYWLERARPKIAATGTTTTGAAIGKVLDAIGWPTTAALRDLDVGDTIPDFSADGSVTGLDLIAGLLEAERGVFYIGPSGIPAYESRHARTLRAASTVAIQNVMTRAQPSVDFGLIRNSVSVIRTQTAFEAFVTDPASILKVGPADLAAISTPYLSSDAQATALATWLLSQVKQPRSPMRSLTIDNREAALKAAMLFANLVDRWTVQEGRGGTNGDYFIEHLAHTIEFGRGTRHSLALLLSEATGVAAFQIGVSRLVAIVTNFLTNPSLELDLASWNTWFSTITRGLKGQGGFTDHEPVFGEYMGRCTYTGGGTEYSADQDGLISGATAGRVFTFTNYVYCSAANVGKNLDMKLREAGGAAGTAQTIVSNALVAGWQRLAVTRTIVQNDRTSLKCLIERNGGLVTGEWFDFDGAQLEESPTANVYVDGSLPGCSWTGTPHASTSRKVLGGDVLVY